MDKKSIGIIVVAVIIAVLVIGGVLVISSQNKNDSNTNSSASDTTSTSTSVSSTTTSVSTSTTSTSTSTTTSTSNDTKNGRYQEATIADILDAKVENKTLVMSVKGKSVKVSNLPSNIKYFSYITSCLGNLEIAAITNSNEVYYATTDLVANLINLDEEVETEESVISKANVKFEKLETSEAVDLSVEIDTRDNVTCRNKYISIVTSSGSLKEIALDETKGKYVVVK